MDKDNYKEIICYCRVKERENFKNWLMECGYRRKYSYSTSGLMGGWFDDNWQNYFYERQHVFSGATNIFKESVDERDSKRDTEKFFSLLDYIESNGQKLAVYYTDDFATLAGYGKVRFVLPTAWLEMELLKDYSHLTVTELKAIGVDGGVTGALMVTGDVTKSDLDDMVSEQKSKMDGI